MEQKFDENKFMQEYARNQRLKSLTLKRCFDFYYKHSFTYSFIDVKNLSRR